MNDKNSSLEFIWNKSMINILLIKIKINASINLFKICKMTYKTKGKTFKSRRNVSICKHYVYRYSYTRACITAYF